MLSLLATTLLLPQGVDFARDVQPILTANCFACHGPDAGARKGKLRLDTHAGAIASVIVPGKSRESELMRRITAKDADDRMPPVKSGKTLTTAQIKTLSRWIDQGATWRRHWSFVPPKRPAVPHTDSNWRRNPIDNFVLARMRGAGLSPSKEADRRTLVRRLSLDLTGLPPSLEMVRAFTKNESPAAYERLVDKLLASPRYGERMAMVWLDAARYADTDGFQADATRNNWPWRDWVVDAYNANKPFDVFTTEQFGGDLLPDATPEQVLATCFHRNHMTNGEGGRDPAESRVDYVIDRVNTVGTVWMGLTLGCAQCHDHKYDPISQKDYYSFNAFFDSIAEDGRAGGGAKPFLKYASPYVSPGLEQSKRWLSKKQAELTRIESEAKKGFDPWLQKLARRVASGHRSWHSIRAISMHTTHGSKLTQLRDNVFRVSGPNPRHDDYILASRPRLRRLTGMRLSVLPDASHTGGGLSLADDGHIILTNLKVSVRTRGRRQMREIEIRSAVADYQKKKKTDKAYGPIRDVLDDDPRTGWSTAGGNATVARTGLFAFAKPVVLGDQQELVVDLRHRSLKGNANIRRFRIEMTDELGPTVQKIGPTPAERLGAVNGDVDKLGKSDREGLLAEFFADHPAVVEARRVRVRARKRFDRYRRASKPVNVMVLAQRKKPRVTHILKRGVWNKRGKIVTETTPKAIGRWPHRALGRLGLAKYLVDGSHPLTARVAVNRYWQMYFGAGLVRTPEDFGLQGKRPTHSGLLDWLAVEFVESGWNVKHIQKTIVMSATYRQSSSVTKAQLRTDPENRLLARAGRFRLPSWMIRDAALQASGLLQTRRGGPPVYPYQPAGVWADSTMGRFHYARSVGDDLYRRSIYGFWRRLVAPTGMFDASKRRTCQVRVVRTNTPLQALTLMNGFTFVEAARVLAQSVLADAEDSATQVSRIVERVLSRLPDAREAATLLKQLEATRRHYAAHPAEAVRLAAQGASPVRADLDPVLLAALPVVASTVLNLDEAITRE